MSSRLYKQKKGLNRRSEQKIEVEDLEGVLAAWGEECFYCGEELDFDNGIGTFDHLVPLGRGGTNHKRNLVPACPSCNHKKDEKRAAYDRRSGRIVFTWKGVTPSEGWSSRIAAFRSG